MREPYFLQKETILGSMTTFVLWYICARGEFDILEIAMLTVSSSGSARGGSRKCCVSSLVISAVNITSIMPHWRELAQSRSSFVLVSETRANEKEQRMIQLGLAANTWSHSRGGR